MVDPAARFESIKIPLSEPVHGVDAVSGVLGVPRWWPTGARVGVILVHGSGRNMDDPILEHLARELTERHFLTLRFNQPAAEAGKQRADSMAVQRRTLRAAISALASDPTAAPAHLFLGGKNLGCHVAADLAASRVRIDGIFFLGYPLHAAGKPETAQIEPLYRLVSPMLFIQGTRDRTCDINVLRHILSRVGAPTTLLVCNEADQHFKALKKGDRSDAEIASEVLEGFHNWITRILE